MFIGMFTVIGMFLVGCLFLAPCAFARESFPGRPKRPANGSRSAGTRHRRATVSKSECSAQNDPPMSSFLFFGGGEPKQCGVPLVKNMPLPPKLVFPWGKGLNNHN